MNTMFSIKLFVRTFGAMANVQSDISKSKTFFKLKC